METITIDDHRIAYQRVGDGPPLVLLHGYVGDGRTAWRPQLDALADELTLIAWDAPGTGRSSDPPEAFGMAGYADVLARFIAALDLGAPHVAGLSFGGALAIELARRHPDVPASLTLVSAYAGWRGSLEPDVADARLAQALALSELSPDELVSTLLPTMFSEGTPKGTIEAFGESLREFHPVGFRAMARAAAEDLRDALPTIEVPTLLVYGERDSRAPLAVARRLESAIAGSELVVLRGAGHVCNLEEPELFNEHMRRFLKRR
jgi:pimeloyl-ACP methyl ester carboxylesterase